MRTKSFGRILTSSVLIDFEVNNGFRKRNLSRGFETPLTWIDLSMGKIEKTSRLSVQIFKFVMFEIDGSSKGC